MKTILACLLLGLACSCQNTGRAPTPIRAPMPMLESIQMPVLEELSPEDAELFKKLPEATQLKLIENDYRLKMTIRKQKAQIDVYNQFAKKNNDLNAETLGLPVEKPETKK